MTVVLGLLAAICYGTSDFAGGVASRRSNAITVLLGGYPVGALLVTAMLPLFPGHLDARVVLFGVLGGAAGLVGVLSLFRAMTLAPMNIVSPVSSVLAAMVPLVFGVATGDRPAASAWCGIALGPIAVVLVSRTSDDHPHGRIRPAHLGLAALAGLGFGWYFIFLARAGQHAGLWPLVISRFASAIMIVPIAVGAGAATIVLGRTLALVLVEGALDAFANMSFLLATRHGLLSLASVLTALYPAVTVLLAVGVLREHLSRVQLAGLGLAAASVVLITL